MIPIRHNHLRQTMQYVNIGHELMGNCGSCEWVAQRNEMHVFHEFVCHHQDDVVIAGHQKTLDKVHANHLPSTVGN